MRASSIILLVLCGWVFFYYAKENLEKRALYKEVREARHLADSIRKDFNKKLEVKYIGFSEANLAKYMKDCKLKHPHIVLAQAAIETDHFKSNLFRVNNNLFGLKIPGRRPTAALGKKNGHAYYDTWQSSVHDYALWQMQNVSGNSEKSYYKSLRGYAKRDSRYIFLVQKLANQFKNKYFTE